ncbi:MAG: SEL1-like repeat protein [Endomicrobium sp.]|nr:SEL1-like repeat protein [Endomicrobium sp.]
MGVMYERGKGVQQNYKEAVNWFQKSADQGDVDAKTALTRILRNKKSTS